MQPDFRLSVDNARILVDISGDWRRQTVETHDKGSAQQLIQAAERGFDSYRDAACIEIHADRLDGWDSLLLAACLEIIRKAQARQISVSYAHLPEGMVRMLDMAVAVPPKDQQGTRTAPGFFELIGSKLTACPAIIQNLLEFIGDLAASIGRFLRGKASLSSRDLWNIFRECGADALPIVTLTCILLGLILAFVSSMQLKLFGAEIYIASLVSVSMTRVMGPVLTGIVLAGRTGASFAAVLGSMQVNEEIDALTGFGISPMDFLVLPRVLGMAVMTPLLTLYADIAGIAGGFLVGVLMLGVSPTAYMDNTLEFLKLSYMWIGLLHALVFGFIISMCGCYQGIRCGRNASAVGRATTTAVVSSIVGIIVSTSIITIIFTIIDI
ncbi:MAG: ABC transporter permease [Mailhella sp.]|nr:ABC transporter permease [Mailhella sp.]